MRTKLTDGFKLLFAFLLSFFEVKDNMTPKPSNIPPGLPQAPSPSLQPTPAPTLPVSEPTTPQTYLWDTPENARHSLRVICDEEGLTVEQKNLMSQVVHCESGYLINATHPNLFKGKVVSCDYGICQWNDYYHGKEISAQQALMDPEKAVRLMCKYVKDGHIKQWVCYSSGLYEKYPA